jgi:hypothetical protein
MIRLEDFRAASPAELPPVPPRKQTGPRRDPFLRGPVPLEWLARACALPKSAVAVGLALWFLRGVRGNHGPVKVTSAVRRVMQLTNEQARRGVHALSNAGLVRLVKGGRGHCAVVEIVERAPASPSQGAVGDL